MGDVADTVLAYVLGEDGAPTPSPDVNVNTYDATGEWLPEAAAHAAVGVPNACQKWVQVVGAALDRNELLKARMRVVIEDMEMTLHEELELAGESLSAIQYIEDAGTRQRFQDAAAAVATLGAWAWS
jgi:hypothetical protein